MARYGIYGVKAPNRGIAVMGAFRAITRLGSGDLNEVTDEPGAAIAQYNDHSRVSRPTGIRVSLGQASIEHA